MPIINDTETKLELLRQRLKNYICGKRYAHTLAVESEINNLCGIFALGESETFYLRVAALLHDVTKEKDTTEQIELCLQGGIPYGDDEIFSPKVFHAMTAPIIIKRDFPEYDTENVILPVRYHTTGRPGMTLTEKLLYLADYIEPTRTFPDCVLLRNEFYGASDPADPKHLKRILLLSYNMTVRNLLDEGAQIHPQTVLAMNALIREE